MKLNTYIPLICSAMLGITPIAAQESPFDPLGEQTEASLPRQVRVQVEYIEMPLTQMTALMADPAASKGDAALRNKINELVKNGKARIIENQMVVARSGEKATAESIREFIYPTEYEPPELPTTVKFEKGSEQSVKSKEISTGPTPTAFETRNLGSTLEVEPTIGENNAYIDVRVSPEIVYHIKNDIWASWKDKHGEANIMMPVFYTLRLNTAVTVANGKPCLLGALSPKDDKGVTDMSRKVFVFVRANVIFPGR
ncbi:MAG: hypothetical protein AB8F34_04765 [Akkermansiaceae bacterium]